MKRSLGVVLGSIFSLCSVLMLGGCSLFGIGGVKSPKIEVYGNVVAWEAVENAASYNIYVNDVAVGTTEKNHFILKDLAEDSSVTVTAVKEDGTESDKSNKTEVQKSVGFSEDETLEVTTDGEHTVDSAIKYVKVAGTFSSAGITIKENRTADLYIELDNVTMTSGQANNCVRTENNIMDASELHFTVVFILKGDNSLTGASQTETPAPQTPTNSQKKGVNGEAGRSAIVLPTVVMTGEGSLTLKGGNGGNGGTGASSSGWSTSLYGDGGDGGVGGGGIKCTTLVLALEKGARVSASGGVGGTGGSPGENGSVVSGPVGTAAWYLHFGENGADGRGLTGTLKEYSGVFQ